MNPIRPHRCLEVCPSPTICRTDRRQRGSKTSHLYGKVIISCWYAFSLRFGRHLFVYWARSFRSILSLSWSDLISDNVLSQGFIFNLLHFYWQRRALIHLSIKSDQWQCLYYHSPSIDSSSLILIIFMTTSCIIWSLYRTRFRPDFHQDKTSAVTHPKEKRRTKNITRWWSGRTVFILPGPRCLSRLGELFSTFYISIVRDHLPIVFLFDVMMMDDLFRKPQQHDKSTYLVFLVVWDYFKSRQISLFCKRDLYILSY